MMKLMNTFTALALTFALAPALVLSSNAFADNNDNQRADAKERSGEHFVTRKPAGSLYADDVIGKTVKHRQSGDEVGEIKDLIIGSNGRVLGAVVSTGGFLGLGGQEVSLGWKHLDHAIEDDDSVFYVNINEETLKNAPEHERK